MRNRRYHIIAILLLTVLAVSAGPVRYQDSTFAFTAKDTIYGVNETYDSTIQYLQMRVYEPQDDTISLRPAIVWMHGGGFTGGSYLDANCVTLCPHFAGRGYVAATVEYRVGVEINADIYNNFQDAVYRAVQDFKAAVRFLKKHAMRYGIDPDQIIIGGASAGGVTTMMYLYWDEEEVPSDMTDRLGSFAASGIPDESDAVAGAVPWAGCVNDTGTVTPAGIPVIALHDRGDPTVPFGYGAALGVPQLAVYGSGHPSVLSRAGGDYRLVDFDNGDHIPGAPVYWEWIDSTRNTIYDRFTGPAAGIRIPGRDIATAPVKTAIFTLEGRQVQPDRLPRGIYLLRVTGPAGNTVYLKKQIIR